MLLYGKQRLIWYIALNLKSMSFENDSTQVIELLHTLIDGQQLQTGTESTAADGLFTENQQSCI